MTAPLTYEEDRDVKSPFDTREFYEICYSYRCTPPTEPSAVVDAFERVKDFGKRAIAKINAKPNALRTITFEDLPVFWTCGCGQHNDLAVGRYCGRCGKILAPHSAALAKNPNPSGQVSQHDAGTGRAASAVGPVGMGYEYTQRLQAALRETASRWDDLAEITEASGPYTNAGFFRASARRCLAAIKNPTGEEG